MKNNLLNPKGRREILEIIGTLPSQFQNSLRELLKQSTPTAENQEFYLSLAKTIQQSIQSGSLGRREFLQLTSLLTSSGLLSLVFPKYAHAGGIMPFGFWGAGARKTAASIDSIAAYRSLLLNGEGSIGALNAFLDSSSNQFSSTKSGNPIQGTFTPFSANAGYWCSYFDGASSLLSSGTPNPTNGNFTVECWIYPFPFASGYRLIFLGDSSGSYGSAINSTGTISYGRSLVATDGTTTNAVNFNAWNHIAHVRTGSTLKIYINGVVGLTVTNSTAFPASATRLGSEAGGGTFYFTGSISNFRIVNGSGLYTSNFTPPTSPLTAVNGTSFLTCQDYRFKDNSTNNLSITGYSSPRIIPNSPFTTTPSTYTPSIHGGSGYFDGNSTFLTLSGNSVFNFGSSDWTVEAWVYLNALPTSDAWPTNWSLHMVVAGTGSPNAGDGINCMIGQTKLIVHSNDVQYASSAHGLNIKSWNHLAYVRSGNTLYFYVNGVSKGSVAFSGSVGVGANTYIGCETAQGAYLNGYLTDLRVVKNVTLYTSAFTPPSAPLTAITNTALLLNFTNGDIIDNSRSNQLTPSGTLTQGTFSPYSIEDGKWSTSFVGVAYAATNGSKSITVPPSTALQLGTGDFTLEFFTKAASGYSSSFNPALSQSVIDEGTGNNTGWIIRVEDLNIGLYNQGALIIGYTPSISTIGRWIHIAFTRSSGVFKLYVDGTLVSTNSTSTTFDMNIALNVRSDTPLVIGGHELVSATTYFGSISNLRILKGTVAYTGNFTTPTGPLRTSGATSATSYSSTTNVNTTFAASTCSLLTCQSRGFVDNANNASLTVYTGPTTTSDSPFTASVTAYSASVHGGSMYLATPGGLTSTQSHTLSGDFTAEAWVYPLAYPNDCYILSIGGYSIITIYNSTLTSSIGGTGSNYNGSGYGSIKLNCWTHLAVTRSGTIIRLFINGTQTYSYTSTNTNITGTIVINDTINARYTGYISDARFTNGAAVYTANFTPPTAPLTATINTAALCNFTNASIIDSTKKNVLARIGDTQISRAQVKYGTGSIYFDGSGDYLEAPLSEGFGTGDITIEAWIYPTTVSGVHVFFDGRITNSSVGIALYTNGSLLSVATGTTVLQTGGTIVANQWQHIAYTRSSSTNRLFLNGVLQSTVTNSTSYSATKIWIGNSVYSEYFLGYVDNLTVLRGKALYTANFTPTTITGY